MKVESKHPQNHSIRVALSPESAGGFKGWVAECLDFDLVAQGATVEEAQQSFQRTLIGHVGLAIKNGKNPFWSCSVLPPHDSKKDVQGLRKMKIEFSRLGTKESVSVQA